MAQGTIKRLVRDRGFGFIRPEGGGDDLFFHRSALRNRRFEEVNEGDKVRYEEGDGGKGPRAEDIEHL